jgi:hypothetical protein
MTNRFITINNKNIRVIRTNVEVPMFQPFSGIQLLSKPCVSRKYLKVQIDGVTIGRLFVSLREAATLIKKCY